MLCNAQPFNAMELNILHSCLQTLDACTASRCSEASWSTPCPVYLTYQWIRLRNESYWNPIIRNTPLLSSWCPNLHPIHHQWWGTPTSGSRRWVTTVCTVSVCRRREMLMLPFKKKKPWAAEGTAGYLMSVWLLLQQLKEKVNLDQAQSVMIQTC